MNKKIISATITQLILFLFIIYSTDSFFAQVEGKSDSTKKSSSVLFIGNSYTFGLGSPVRLFHSELIKDINGTKLGGVPALFKMFSTEASLDLHVFIEASPGKNLDFHFNNKAGIIGKAWDHVVMQGYSLLDRNKPGDPALLVSYAKRIVELLKNKNPKVDIRLVSTWSRPDETYLKSGHWYGKSIKQMALDIRKGYELARLECSPDVNSVIPVGQAFNRAIDKAVADPNPYDGIKPGQINLWTYDNFHASSFGYYLSALMIFGDVTGLDPRSLGKKERSAFELGFSEKQTEALQQIAFEELIKTNNRKHLHPFNPVVESLSANE
jgi:hypothetical protein